MDERFKQVARYYSTTLENLISDTITNLIHSSNSPLLKKFIIEILKLSSQFPPKKDIIELPLPIEIVREVELYPHVFNDFEQLAHSLGRTTAFFMREITIAMDAILNQNSKNLHQLNNRDRGIIQDLLNKIFNSRGIQDLEENKRSKNLTYGYCI